MNRKNIIKKIIITETEFNQNHAFGLPIHLVVDMFL
jgi:hypothetical protein